MLIQQHGPIPFVRNLQTRWKALRRGEVGGKPKWRQSKNSWHLHHNLFPLLSATQLGEKPELLAFLWEGKEKTEQHVQSSDSLKGLSEGHLLCWLNMSTHRKGPQGRKHWEHSQQFTLARSTSQSSFPGSAQSKQEHPNPSFSWERKETKHVREKEKNKTYI